jgi:HSP20 family protein
MSVHTTPQDRVDLSDWPGSPLSELQHHRPGTQPIPTEEYLSDGRYTIRFELPGIDPQHDLDLSVDAGVLTVQAERAASAAARYHSHFRYGTFCSHVTLPAGADEDGITATYRNGVLEVTVTLAARPTVHSIPVTTAPEATS